MNKSKTPSELDIPSFLVNFPFTVDNEVNNNVYMKPDDAPYNMSRTYRQWMKLYKELTKKALVYILPSGDKPLQDLPFVANLGIVLPHLENTVLISNYASQPRVGEDELGIEFFNMMNYEVVHSIEHFEGEADLKWIRDNIYIGAYGQRTSLHALNWMEDRFGMKIIKVHVNDPMLYHLDCSLFPLDDIKTLVATTAFDDADLKCIATVTDIVSVPHAYRHSGWTNSVRLGNKILAAVEQNEGVDQYEDLLYKHDLELKNVNLSEFAKSGADLSCCVMHLNRKNM